MEGEVTGNTNLCRDLNVFSLSFSLETDIRGKRNVLIAGKHMKNVAAEKPFSTEGLQQPRRMEGFAYPEWSCWEGAARGLCKSLIGWAGADCRSRGCTHCSTWVLIMQITPPSQGPGQLAKWEKLWLCISECSAFSSQTCPQTEQKKHKHTALPPPLLGSTSHWAARVATHPYE